MSPTTRGRGRPAPRPSDGDGTAPTRAGRRAVASVMATRGAIVGATPSSAGAARAATAAPGRGGTRTGFSVPTTTGAASRPEGPSAVSTGGGRPPGLAAGPAVTGLASSLQLEEVGVVPLLHLEVPEVVE